MKLKLFRRYGRNYWVSIDGPEREFWYAPATSKSMFKAALKVENGWCYLARGLFYRLVLPVITWFLVAAVVLAVIGYAGWVLLMEVTK